MVGQSRVALVVASLIACASWSHAAPQIDRPVVDQAGVLSDAGVDKISRLLLDHRAATGVQMAVLVVDSTSPLPIEEFSLEVAEAWGGGDKGRDDGILFVLAIRDRRMRLEVGYGLEDVIPDAKAKRMIDEVIPLLRFKDYDGGVDRVVRLVIAETADLRPGEGVPFSYKLRRYVGGDNYLLYFLLGVVLVLFPLAVSSRLWPKTTKLRRRRNQSQQEFERIAAQLRRQWKVGKLAVIAAFLVTLGGGLALVVGYVGGAWVWNPVLICCGFVHGTALWLSLRPRYRKNPLRAIGIVLLTCVVGAVIYYVLHVLGPSYYETTGAETGLLMFVTMFALVGYPAMFAIAIGTASGGGSTYRSSYSSSSSSSSYSYSSRSSYSSSSSSSSYSSSSSSDSYSGGGGSFGGGGASSSW